MGQKMEKFLINIFYQLGKNFVKLYMVIYVKIDYYI